jgi:beta-glucosidase
MRGQKRSLNLRTLFLLTGFSFACVVEAWKADGLGADYPFRNISLGWDERVEDLVDRLTLKEMVDQMANGGPDAAPGIDRLGIPPYNFNTECLRGLVKPNQATAFPQSIGLGASFSPDLIKAMAEAISTEARGTYNDAKSKGQYPIQKGITCFSPCINIARHPLWGRTQEGYGEDPFLTGMLASAYVSGLQGDHPRYVRASSGCKHFAVHSGPEDIPSSRFSFNSVVSERDFRVTFMPHFKRCIEAGSLNVMCSYNRINGVPACGNERLLTEIGRKEYGYKGLYISDAGAIENIYTSHRYVKSMLDAVALAANSGVDLELGSSPAYVQLYDAVAKNLVPYNTIVERTKKLFYVRMRLGAFDPPEMNPYESIKVSVVQSEDHRRLAIIAAAKSFVLLKNENVLPLAEGTIKNLAVVGPMADNLEQLFGDYSATPNPAYSSTPYGGLKSAADTVVLAHGCTDNWCSKYNADEIKNATLAADVVIVCLGTGQQVEEEGSDRADLNLPGHQEQLMEDVMAYAKKPVIVLIFSGGPLDITLAKHSSSVGAIVQCFLPAQSTGAALRAVLFSKDGHVVSPAGRLPYTWPLSIAQVPPMTNYSMEGRTYRYFKGPGAPLYPFGYGLSYAQFKYSELVISPMAVNSSSDILRITVKCFNAGPYNSDEVTQVYISWRDCPVVMPQRQLVAIARTMIPVTDQPQTIELQVKAEDLMIWDDVKGFILHPGVIDVHVGGQQPDQETSVGSNILQTAIQITP